MNGNDITIFHAHTGASIRVNRYYFLSLDELKRFCCSQFNVPSQQLFLLSSFGLKLKPSSLEHADEVYVYDKNLFSIDDKQTIQRYITHHYADAFDNLIHPINSPLLDVDLERLSASKNSRQLIGLLTTNLGWVAAIQSDSQLFLKRSLELRSQLTVLFKSLKVANLYIDNYCNEVKKSYDASLDFLVSLQKQSLGLRWKEQFSQLENITTVEGLPLSTLLDQNMLDEQATECLHLNDKLNKELLAERTRISTSNHTRTKVDQELDLLDSETKKILDNGDPEGWLKELGLLSDRVKNDTKYLLEQTKNSVDDIGIDLIVETFQLHKTQFVTKIHDFSLSLYNLFLSYNELFRKMQVSLSTFLQRLSLAQAQMVTLKESLKTVTADIERVQELESYLAHTVDLPLLYGLYVIEGVRRSEWLASMKRQAGKTNESFGALREKEIKTRSNWIKNYGDILKLMQKDISSFNSESLVSFDLNVNEGETLDKPYTYENAEHYIQCLQSVNTEPEVVKILVKSLNEIPMKTSKVAIQEPKPAESTDVTIKGYKSRIKKLENLLHQEQFKNYQQWPSSDHRLSVASRLSMNEKLSGAMRPDASFRVSSSTLNDSGEINKLTEENRKLTNDLKRHKNTMEMLSEELKSARHQSSTSEFEVQSLKSELEKLKDTHAAELSKLQLKITEQEVSKTVLMDNVHKLEQEVSTHSTKAMESDRLIKELKEDHSKALNALQEQVKSKDLEMTKMKDDHTANDLQPAIDSLKTELEGVKASVSERESEIDELKKALAERDAQLADKDRQLSEKNETLKEKDSMIDTLTTTASKDADEVRAQNLELEETNLKLKNHIETLKENYERLSSMKNDLLENMSNRENEFGKEKVLHQEEIEALKMKLEELEKDHATESSSMSEVHRKHTTTIVQLVVIINSLIIKARDLSDVLILIYDLFCSSLKAMGLLAVRSESTGEVSIIRVKGLKKATGDLSATVDLANGLKPDLKQEVIKCSNWLELPDAKLLEMGSADSEALSESLDVIVEMLIETYNLTTFEEKYLAFVDRVTNLNPLYLSSVAKRFKEVEHLAKKELKENRKLRDLAKNKVSVRDFQKGDLVLFLPTRANGNNQWAAFNDKGDAKFFMKNELKLSAQKQWFIGRVLEIEEADNKEFLITAEECSVA